MTLQKFLTLLILSTPLSFINGCSSINANLWHSLESNNDINSPSTEPKKTSEKPLSYSEYEKQRESLLNKTPNP